jgi:hypothetical protein
VLAHGHQPCGVPSWLANCNPSTSTR